MQPPPPAPTRPRPAEGIDLASGVLFGVLAAAFLGVVWAGYRTVRPRPGPGEATAGDEPGRIRPFRPEEVDEQGLPPPFLRSRFDEHEGPSPYDTDVAPVEGAPASKTAAALDTYWDTGDGADDVGSPEDREKFVFVLEDAEEGVLASDEAAVEPPAEEVPPEEAPIEGYLRGESGRSRVPADEAPAEAAGDAASTDADAPADAVASAADAEAQAAPDGDPEATIFGELEDEDEAATADAAEADSRPERDSDIVLLVATDEEDDDASGSPESAERAAADEPAAAAPPAEEAAADEAEEPAAPPTAQWVDDVIHQELETLFDYVVDEDQRGGEEGDDRIHPGDPPVSF